MFACILQKSRRFTSTICPMLIKSIMCLIWKYQCIYVHLLWLQVRGCDIQGSAASFHSTVQRSRLSAGGDKDEAVASRVRVDVGTSRGWLCCDLRTHTAPRPMVPVTGRKKIGTSWRNLVAPHERLLTATQAREQATVNQPVEEALFQGFGAKCPEMQRNLLKSFLVFWTVNASSLERWKL